MFLFLGGINPETDEQIQTPYRPADLQYRMGHGLPFLQYRAAALRPSDGDGLRVADRDGALLAGAAVVAEGRKGREGRRAEADRRRAADRRPAQGVHHVRPFDDFAHRRFDHRYHRAAAGAAALGAAGDGPFHEIEDRGAGARHGGSRGRGAGGRVVVAPAFAPLGQRDDSALRLRYVALHGVVQAADRQIPDYDRAEVALLRGGGRRPAVRP